MQNEKTTFQINYSKHLLDSKEEILSKHQTVLTKKQEEIWKLEIENGILQRISFPSDEVHEKSQVMRKNRDKMEELEIQLRELSRKDLSQTKREITAIKEILNYLQEK